MQIKKEPIISLTSRDVSAYQSISYPTKSEVFSLTKSLTKKKYTEPDCLNTISPWNEEEYTCHKRAEKKGKKLKDIKAKVSTNLHKIKSGEINMVECMIESSRKTEALKKGRSKTEMIIENMVKREKEKIENSSLFQIKLSTIDIANNMKSIKNTRYLGGEVQERKMSMHKFRQNFIESTRSKGSHTRTLSSGEYKNVQTNRTTNNNGCNRSNINGNVNKNEDISNVTEQLLVKKLKSLEIENEDSSTLFFFRTKNNTNVMNREKNIMKIRNLGLSKCRRVQTENNMK